MGERTIRVYGNLGFTQLELRVMIAISGILSAEGGVPKTELPERYANVADSPLEFTVKADEKNDFTIEFISKLRRPGTASSESED